MILNCTQHTLPEEGVELLEGPVVNMKEDNPELFGELSNMTGDEELTQLSYKLRDYIYEILKRNGGKSIYVVLPIGSPAFMFEFAQFMEWASNETEEGKINQYFISYLFAHSERNVEEGEDGTKKVKFHFKKWIKV